MGSGGSRTLWSPSYGAGVPARADLEIDYRASASSEITSAPGTRPVVDGVNSQARIEQLGPVSSMPYGTSTSGLSTWWSSTALRYLILREASRLDAFSGYPVHTLLPS